MSREQKWLVLTGHEISESEQIQQKRLGLCVTEPYQMRLCVIQSEAGVGIFGRVSRVLRLAVKPKGFSEQSLPLHLGRGNMNDPWGSLNLDIYSCLTSCTIECDSHFSEDCRVARMIVLSSSISVAQQNLALDLVYVTVFMLFTLMKLMKAVSSSSRKCLSFDHNAHLPSPCPHIFLCL